MNRLYERNKINMKVNEIIKKARERGISLWCENGKIRYFKQDGKLEEDIKQLLIDNKENIIRYWEEDIERFEVFPLTDIQTAYLLGRRGSFEYGDVASHLYLELEYPRLDGKKVQKIWNELITKHDMLRVIILQNGTQRVLKEVNEYQIYISNEAVAGEKIRNEWKDKFYETEKWPLFDIGITNYERKSILHLSFDFLISDWASIWRLLREFEIKYYDKIDRNKQCVISFRNYILNEKGMKNTLKYVNDKEYWRKRLETMPEAPILPILPGAKNINRFVRKSEKLNIEKWETIKKFSMKNGITPTAAVLSIFAMCIERWSENKNFALNLTTLTRNSKYPDIYDVIGDFTSVNVLEIRLSKDIPFYEFAKRVNKQLFDDLDHNTYSGIEVIRDLRKIRKNPSLFYPIIFTSSIGVVDLDGMVGKINDNGISQTPQAFLDCQVMDSKEGLFINWDIREGIFDEKVIKDIFETFIESLNRFSEIEEVWFEPACVKIPAYQLDTRKHINNTFKNRECKTLQDLFLKSTLKSPKKVAVVDETGEYTYEELLWRAYSVAEKLEKCGCKKGDYVGIKLDKGVFQIASVLGILFLGATFVPIDNEQPEIRANKIMDLAQIKYLICEEKHRDKEKYNVITKEDIHIKREFENPAIDNFFDVAYVIFTSGSTGIPKGVVIEQQAVINTIIDINERFKIQEDDSVLALSQLHFDLSIYDIFGMLASGGTLIIPDKARYKDPSYWLKLIKKWNITVWNSVPTFMEMFVDYLDRFYNGENLSINKVLLSGDWIPINLPERIRKFLKDVKIYSLGGATEASIWSIYHECEKGEVYAGSVPYGIPLSNQGFKILDANMKDCPNMVRGELYITGKGLARGYLGDPEKTRSSFIKFNNEKIYKTGDFGRYLYNGEIQFLGRKDSQIKIAGHRIEIGEIEKALIGCCPGQKCSVTTINLNGETKIVAVIVAAERGQKDKESIREKLKQYLPHYMIPFFIEFVNEIPYTNNGKVDKKAIQKIFSDKRDEREKNHSWNLSDIIENEVYLILKKILKTKELHLEDNLFDIGADSLIMAQIAGAIKENIMQESATFDEILRQILNNPTARALIKFLKERRMASTDGYDMEKNTRLLAEDKQEVLYVFFHAALGTTNCYRFMEKEMRRKKLGDLLFINMENADKYCSIKYSDLVNVITDAYVEKIEQLKYRKINLVGYCLGGIIALNVAVKLLERGSKINNLFVLDSYPVSGKIEDDFIDEIIFLPNYQITLSEVIEGIEDYELMQVISQERENNNGNIPANSFSNILQTRKNLKGCTKLLEFAQNKKEERFKKYAQTISKKFQVNINAKMLETAFRIYQHSFKGAEVELPFYSGDICFFSASEEQKYLFIDKNENLELWNSICLGDFKEVEIPGNHVTCILNEENAIALVNRLQKEI